jgi:hypothetical protein
MFIYHLCCYRITGVDVVISEDDEAGVGTHEEKTPDPDDVPPERTGITESTNQIKINFKSDPDLTFLPFSGSSPSGIVALGSD